MINSVLSWFNLSILTSILKHLEDMNSVCQKPGLHFCETYE